MGKLVMMNYYTLMVRISNSSTKNNIAHPEILFRKSILLQHFFFTANNLYGSSMTLPLPIADFEWLTEDEISALDWMNMTESQSTGYIVEVDLEYPSHLHKSHNSLVLAPERLSINREMLSQYAKGNYKIFLIQLKLFVTCLLIHFFRLSRCSSS
ncbi:MAG TPA: hypothetical protein VIY47_07740 [Ignavibacteriaceae bacterium]